MQLRLEGWVHFNVEHLIDMTMLAMNSWPFFLDSPCAYLFSYQLINNKLGLYFRVKQFLFPEERYVVCIVHTLISDLRQHSKLI